MSSAPHTSEARATWKHTLVTAPNPRVRSWTEDAGQRGWRLHTVVTPANVDERTLHRTPALCGLRPSHGWAADLFIDRPCTRCEKAKLRRKVAT